MFFIGGKMTFQEYQEKALSTAIYPEKYRLIYPTLKYSVELGELSEKIGKVDKDTNGEFTPESIQQILLEIGDVFWYIAALSKEVGFELDWLSKKFVSSCKSFPYLAIMQLQIQQRRDIEQFERMITNGINRECLTYIQKFMSDLLWRLEDIIAYFGEETETVAQMNLDKLASRKERDVIKGSGDDR